MEGILNEEKKVLLAFELDFFFNWDDTLLD
jgi:hypothetical protein